jgi:hypothetical protein
VIPAKGGQSEPALPGFRAFVSALAATLCTPPTTSSSAHPPTSSASRWPPWATSSWPSWGANSSPGRAARWGPTPWRPSRLTRPTASSKTRRFHPAHVLEPRTRRGLGRCRFRRACAINRTGIVERIGNPGLTGNPGLLPPANPLPRRGGPVPVRPREGTWIEAKRTSRRRANRLSMRP